jgi:thymidylate synthase (FAD)
MANINELSGRYSVLDKEFYIPEAGQMCSQSLTNKQGRAEPVPEAKLLMEEMRYACNDSFGMYEGANQAGLTRELARIVLPLSTYTTWTWKCDLHNLLHFLSLRLDSHAQYEIRVYADQIWKWVCEWVPIIAEAFTDYRLEAMTLSRLEVGALQKIIGSIAVTGRPEVISPQFAIDSIPNKREREEFLVKLNRLTDT